MAAIEFLWPARSALASIGAARPAASAAGAIRRPAGGSPACPVGGDTFHGHDHLERVARARARALAGRRPPPGG